MDSTQAKFLLPVASILEIIGITTLLTNDGMLIPKVDMGFTVPAILPVEVQGIGLMVAGGSLTAYAILNMQN